MAMSQPQAQDNSGGGSQTEAMMQALQAADQALLQVAQMLGQIAPEAGEALQKLDEQFRQIVMQTLQQAQGGGQPQRQMAPQHGSPETGGRPAQQAY